MKVLNIGISERPICGVHDYGCGFAEELRTLGDDVETRWCVTECKWDRTLDWIRSLDTGSEPAKFDVIVWHYSVFSYGVRGIPVLVLPLLARLRRLSVPVVVVLHEYAYAWHRNGWRGATWAVTQRLALLPLVWRARGIIVTVEERADWLGRRFWLPRRPVFTAPVFSNLPVPDDPLPVATVGRRIGMFGYRSSERQLTMKALAGLNAEVPSAELWLIGAPGPDTEIGLQWREAAATAGVEGALKFTGPISSGNLASAVSGCDLAVFHDGGGPSSRKTTLAAFLAAGVPVVAVDGPNTWRALVDEGAVRLVDPNSGAIAANLRELILDATARQELGWRGQEFYRKHQARRKVVSQIANFIKEIL